jgi:glycosyltransferase involved in cell wall biosynthesis
MAADEADVWLLLVGDGPELDRIKDYARTKGVVDRIVFAGSRADIPRLMAAMDIFVMPSWHEGFGLVLIEAQASGLPCVIADTIPAEVEVLDGHIQRLSPSDSPTKWSEVIRRVLDQPPLVRDDSLRILEKSRFSITCSVDELVKAYEEGLNR